MKMLKLLALVFVVFLLLAAPAMAAGEPTSGSSYVLSGQGIAGGLGMGLTIIGAGIGFGKIGSAALDGMARQPEVAGNIQIAMIIIAAMLEGATLAAVVLSFLVGNKATF
jgi:F-type H+-transporting ATPase subunit c